MEFNSYQISKHHIAGYGCSNSHCRVNHTANPIRFGIKIRISESIPSIANSSIRCLGISNIGNGISITSYYTGNWSNSSPDVFCLSYNLHCIVKQIIRSYKPIIAVICSSIVPDLSRNTAILIITKISPATNWSYFITIYIYITVTVANCTQIISISKIGSEGICLTPLDNISCFYVFNSNLGNNSIIVDIDSYYRSSRAGIVITGCSNFISSTI